MTDNTGFSKTHWDQHPLKIDGLIYAFCNEDGLIGFGSDVPTGQHMIIAGCEDDMAIVRCLAHRDGNSYWVPGFYGTTHWRARLNRFIEECSDHMDDGSNLIPIP